MLSIEEKIILKNCKTEYELRLKIQSEYEEKMPIFNNSILNSLISNYIFCDEVIKMSYEELLVLNNFGDKKIRLLYDTLKSNGYNVNHLVLPLTKEEYIEKNLKLIEENYIEDKNNINFEMNELFKESFKKQTKKMTVNQLKKYNEKLESIIEQRKVELKMRRNEIFLF